MRYLVRTRGRRGKTLAPAAGWKSCPLCFSYWNLQGWPELVLQFKPRPYWRQTLGHCYVMYWMHFIDRRVLRCTDVSYDIFILRLYFCNRSAVFIGIQELKVVLQKRLYVWTMVRSLTCCFCEKNMWYVRSVISCWKYFHIPNSAHRKMSTPF